MSDDYIRYVCLLSPTEKPRDETAIRRHVEFLQDLESEGRLELCGPFHGGKGGIMIFKAFTLIEAKATVAADPLVKEGFSTYDLMIMDLSCAANNHLGMGSSPTG